MQQITDNALANMMLDDIIRFKINSGLPVDHDGNRMIAAATILRNFLDAEFLAKKIRISDNPDPFMCNSIGDQASSRFTYMHRVCSLANYLFILRKAKGLEQLLKRLKNHDSRLSYFEAHAASMFASAGFLVEMRAEIGKKQCDFDFIATLGGDAVNVEVTACTNPNFSSRNITNVLHNERKQLPPSHPAVIYILLPPTWRIANKDLDFWLMKTTLKFFSQTKRINCVIYMSEVFWQFKEGAMFLENTYPIFNPNPRLRAPELWRLFPNGVANRVGKRRIRRGVLGPIRNLREEFSYMKLIEDVSRFVNIITRQWRLQSTLRKINRDRFRLFSRRKGTSARRFVDLPTNSVDILPPFSTLGAKPQPARAGNLQQSNDLATPSETQSETGGPRRRVR